MTSPRMLSTLYAAVALTLLQAATLAGACTCTPLSFQASYYASARAGTPFSLARVLEATLRPEPDGDVLYRLQVVLSWAGCRRPEPYTVIAFSRALTAECGVALSVGRTYLLPLPQFGVTDLSLCKTNIERSLLTPAQNRFLDARNLCCRGRCQCLKPPKLSCSDRPCAIAKKPCPAAKTCVDNYCTGCFAEWFTANGEPACIPR